MQINEQFVLSLNSGRPVVLTVPHDGFWLPEITGFATGPGLGGEACVAAIASTVNFEGPVASVVRGLMPRRLCNYNATRERAGPDKEATRLHDAYHSAIEAFIGERAHKTSVMHLIDLHGFNASKVYSEYDLVLGSVGGKTTPRGLDLHAQRFFSSVGYRVKYASAGEKFSGGYTVRRHGGDSADALQIEISSQLRNHEDASTWMRFSSHLRAFVMELQ